MALSGFRFARSIAVVSARWPQTRAVSTAATLTRFTTCFGDGIHLGMLRRQHQSLPFSTSESSSYSPLVWWRNRQEKKEEVKYKERLQAMANKEDWTIGDMKEELNDVVKSWISKIPIIGSNKEILAAKRMHKTVTGLAEIIGDKATSERLGNMTRVEKLKASLQGESTVEDINILIQQFDSMSLMHKVVRRRKLEGKKIPETAEAVQTMMQTEGQRLLTKTQKTKMMSRTKEIMRKSRRR
jgi:hypothetical protein|uniref:Signal recognition particle SRP54 subunit M-domain domain-containing protein n=1 Tax=Phaeodactylum tricornutum TaxID=2850 RepID=A0A8J9TUT5_PHATR